MCEQCQQYEKVIAELHAQLEQASNAMLSASAMIKTQAAHVRRLEGKIAEYQIMQNAMTDASRRLHIIR